MKSPITRLLAAAALLAPLALPAETRQPEPSAETRAARDARLAWWRDARFGMFIHWGLYSGLEGDNNGKAVSNFNTEWHQKRLDLDTDSYAAMAKPKFKPAPDCAKAWAKLAKDAGCKYVVLTTKHHEGFGLFDSKLTDYTAKALVGRDMVKEYADATRAEGLHVGFYHSLIDWHHSDYDFRKAKGLPYPEGGKKVAGETPRDHSKYIAYLHGQVVDELLSNYGKIDVLWFDFSSHEFGGEEAWGVKALVPDIIAKQPGIIFNNRLFGDDQTGSNLKARHGDFATPEQAIPENGLPGQDWETCMTINNTWGYSKHDTNWKTTTDLIRKLCDVASKGGNFLLNIGPKGDGSIPPQIIERMEGMGAWMKVNGDAIYGTSASLFTTKFPWGRVTTKGDTLNLLVFDRPKDGRISLPLTQGEGATAKLLADGAPVKVESFEDKLVVTLPEQLSDASATVVTVKFPGTPVAVEAMVLKK